MARHAAQSERWERKAALNADIYHARRVPGPDGTLREAGDRWQQALLYAEIARACFAEAERRPATS